MQSARPPHMRRLSSTHRPGRIAVRSAASPSTQQWPGIACGPQIPPGIVTVPGQLTAPTLRFAHGPNREPRPPGERRCEKASRGGPRPTRIVRPPDAPTKTDYDWLSYWRVGVPDP